MKKVTLFVRSCVLVALFLASAFTQTARAVILDGGIDPANLGKGDWVYFMSYCTNKMGGNVPSVTNLTSFLNYEKSQGIRYIIVKAGTGSTNFLDTGVLQFTTNLCNAAHNAGLLIFGYTRSYGSDVPGEIALATRVFNCGADGFVIDAEAEWESYNSWIGSNGPTLATQLASGIKSNWPTKFLAHAPMPIISYHSSFPYKEFGRYCDAVMPQDYWIDFGKTPSATIDWMDTEWKAFQNSLTGSWTNAIKPLVPVGAVYAASVPAKDVLEFMDYLVADPACVTAGGYKGANYWRADMHSSAQWANIKDSTIGVFTGIVNNIVIDNVSATRVGTWSSSTTATNKFGTNYNYKSQGTGAAYAQYTPSILTAGDYEVYEWHTVGSNRTTAAPHVINHAGGTTTVNVNQQLNDAQWNLIGTYSFNAGTSGNVRIADNFPDAGQVVISDGLKFVFIGGATLQPPTAPSNLTATRISSTQINLAWTDTDATTEGFIVYRGTTSGGPYSQIRTLAAGSTACSDLNLTPDTTYYYVVKATNSAGSSPNSNQASATTTSAPAAPSNLSATASGTSKIILTWSDNSANENNFIVARSTTSGGPYTDIATLAANTTTWTNTGLAQSTTYYYVVRASNAVGSSANSNEDSATTAGVPAVPSNLTATAASSSEIDLTWSDNSDNELNFIVGRSLTSGGVYTDIVILGANVTSYTDTGLTANTKYYYVVRASNGSGSSVNSAEANATTLAQATPPAAPSGLSAVATRATRIELSWDDNSNDETSFVVARSTTAGGPYTDIATLAANTTTYASGSLTANTTYYYVVRAVGPGGTSANSAEASATTYESNLLIDNKSAVVVGTWSTGTSSTDKYASDYRFANQGTGANYVKFTPYIATAAAYEVYEWHPQGSNRSSAAPVVVTHSAGTTTNSVNQKVNGGVWNYIGTYDFASGSVGYIKITDAFPDGTQVVMADAIKLVQASAPVAPSGLTASASASGINLSWIDNSTNETSFVVARSTTSGGPYTDVGTVTAGATSYTDSSVAGNTTYYYVVRAQNGTGASANSAQASATSYRAVHVNSITMSWVLSSGKYRSRAVVNVKDSAGVNVNSATVAGTFSGSINESKTAVTSSGNATLTTTASISSGTVTFTVTNITGTNMSYDSAANVVTSKTHSR